MELRVDRDGFTATVSELEKRGRNAFAVIVEPSDPAWLAVGESCPWNGATGVGTSPDASSEYAYII